MAEMDLERLRCVTAEHARLEDRFHVAAGSGSAGHRRVDDLHLGVEDLVVGVQIVQGFGLTAAGPPGEDLELARCWLILGWRGHWRSGELAAADRRWRCAGRCRRWGRCWLGCRRW